jgi:cell division septal protein FtsQ
MKNVRVLGYRGASDGERKYSAEERAARRDRLVLRIAIILLLAFFGFIVLIFIVGQFVGPSPG